VHTAYRFVLEVRTLDGEVLHREALSPDWVPAVESARLTGLRTHGVWKQANGAEPRLEPLWHEAVGEPLLQGVRVHMEYDGLTWFADVPTAQYFSDAARSVVAARLVDGQVKPADRVRYAVAAYAAAAGGAPRLRFDTMDMPQPFAVRDRGFGGLVAQSTACGEGDSSDVDVVLPEDVLDEMCALTRDAGERETGGILLGHLCRDDARADIGIEVTAHIPARHTVADPVKLTFTSDTWTDVRAAVALRKAGELMVGWWHSHPALAWCAKCPIERQRDCQLTKSFLSADDRALHRAMFPCAFTLALVVTHSVLGLDTTMFGWRHGGLASRGFRLRPGGGTSAGRSMAPASVSAPRAALGAACVAEPGPTSTALDVTGL
jgi:proteasome lid subunit RPN8/RPN11